MDRFNIILRPICWLKEVIRTVDSGLPISGHDFVEVGDELVCEICGLREELDI